MRADRQTDRQTDTFIALLRTPPGSEVGEQHVLIQANNIRTDPMRCI